MSSERAEQRRRTWVGGVAASFEEMERIDLEWSRVAEAVPTEGDAGKADPLPDSYNADGVDLSLVRSMLKKTPTERLQAVQDAVDLLASVRRAGLR